MRRVSSALFWLFPVEAKYDSGTGWLVETVSRFSTICHWFEFAGSCTKRAFLVLQRKHNDESVLVAANERKIKRDYPNQQNEANCDDDEWEISPKNTRQTRWPLFGMNRCTTNTISEALFLAWTGIPLGLSADTLNRWAPRQKIPKKREKNPKKF